MKYRCLTDEELKELEQEFKHFLISNNVYTEEWEELNKKKDKRVQELVELFSDVVLDKAIKNIKYLEHITPQGINSFKCNEDQLTLIGVTSRNKSIDFTVNTFSDFKDELDIFKTNKPYFKQRELEVFDLLQSGCSIINEERFKKLELAHTYSTKQMKN
jgi:ATP/maltotriose-dependent transcriptional regulator MalT